MTRLAQRPDTFLVTFDQCVLGLRSTGRRDGPIRKRTSVLTNSRQLYLALLPFACPKTHEHVQLTETSSERAGHYPEEFCRVICQALRAEMQLSSDAARALSLQTHRKQEKVVPHNRCSRSASIAATKGSSLASFDLNLAVAPTGDASREQLPVFQGSRDLPEIALPAVAEPSSSEEELIPDAGYDGPPPGHPWHFQEPGSSGLES